MRTIKENGSIQNKSVGRVFLISLFSSWTLNPIAVLTLHFSGLATDPALVHVLLATAAASPLQILLNESVATRQAIFGIGPTLLARTTILTVQIAAVVGTLKYDTSVTAASNFQIALICFLICVSSLLSYDSTVNLYKHSIQGNLHPLTAALTGAIPPIVSAATYIATASLSNKFDSTSYLLTSLAITPTLAVWILVTRPKTASRHSPKGGGAYSARDAIASACVMLPVSIWATDLRSRIAANAPEHVATVLIILNIASSLLMTMTRAKYLDSAESKPLASLPIFAATAVAAGIALQYSAKTTTAPAQILFLIGAQLFILNLIERTRRAKQQTVE